MEAGKGFGTTDNTSYVPAILFMKAHCKSTSSILHTGCSLYSLPSPMTALTCEAHLDNQANQTVDKDFPMDFKTVIVLWWCFPLNKSKYKEMVELARDPKYAVDSRVR